MTSSEISSERLIVDGLEYALDFDSYTTLMAHGLLMKDGDACRLSTPEEMRRDPGSAGVNHPEPLAVLAIVKQALRTELRDRRAADKNREDKSGSDHITRKGVRLLASLKGDQDGE